MGRKQMKRQLKNKKNYSLDVMRGVACLFVVLIHCPLPGVLGEILRAIGRFAVPFFVMISGYFWYREDEGQRVQATKKALMNIVKLTVLGTLFCTLVNSVGSLVSGNPPFYWLTSAFSPQMVWEFVVFNRAAFLSSIMYYLFGMIYTYVLVLWLDRYGLVKCGLFATPVLLVMNILFCTFFGAPWYCAGNWLFTCVPFFFCGYYLRIKGAKLIKQKLHLWLIGLCVGILLTIGEYKLFGDVYCGIGTVLTAVCVFVICLKRPSVGKGHPRLVEWIREMSVGIFLVHCTFRDVLKNVLGQGLAEGYWMPVTVLVVSIAFVWGSYLIYGKIKLIRMKRINKR